MRQTNRKKLIEVALPLAEINDGSKAETENPFLKGHPRAIHNWWARTPLSVCRAILFAQLVDDPGEGLDAASAEDAREPLLNLVRRLGTWDATTDNRVNDEARAVVNQQFGGKPPAFWDMFAGRGSISIEAQRLGLRVYSSDLNPVAVTIQKALLQYPQQFAGMPPINAESQRKNQMGASWHGKGAEGLIEDICVYGEWVRQQAIERIGHLYPNANVHGGARITVGAWLWARTVRCPNPACGAETPLVRSFNLSKKKGRQARIEPVIERSTVPPEVRFEVNLGEGNTALNTVERKGARCICCNEPIPLDHVRSEGKKGRIGHSLMAMVGEANQRRVYLAPDDSQVVTASKTDPDWCPDTALPEQALGFRVQLYGMTKHADLFTSRQLVALTTFSELVSEARNHVLVDTRASGLDQDRARLYADAVSTYLACALSRMTDYHCALATWNPTNENIGHLFQRQAIPMAWDFAEANPLDGKLDFSVAARWVAESLKTVPTGCEPANVFQYDARLEHPPVGESVVVSTDPPYYDNIGYADLSDFFYVWLRRTLRIVDPEIFQNCSHTQVIGIDRFAVPT